MAISCARHRKSVFMISANAFFALSFSVGKVKAIKFLIWKILSASWTLRQPTEKGVVLTSNILHHLKLMLVLKMAVMK